MKSILNPPNVSSVFVVRLRLLISGIVQGIGFRPFIFQLAKRFNLKGWVKNSTFGVTIEVEGKKETLEEFIGLINQQKPAHAFIQNMEYVFLDSVGFSNFEIRESETVGRKTAFVLPDMATCPECVKEIFNLDDRRYFYPFTNCTHCGPRFTIIESLPYDRKNTTMKNFVMCEECEREYHDPLNRRFHAQPNACPQCGPHMELWDEKGEKIFSHHSAILHAVNFIREGKIIALKGLGGFQLIVDARNHVAVERLRERKHREEKPLALMFPSLENIRSYCDVSAIEEQLLTSFESPIVLLRKKIPSDKTPKLAASVAPSNPYLGVMLPYTPLHHILMRELNFPIVATSGNISDEPMCIDENEALVRLSGIADYFLVHNRPILRHTDDSVVRVMVDRPLMIRRARGYAPLPISVKEEMPAILAVGGHLKNTISLCVKNNIFVSQHIGDLETEQSMMAFYCTIGSFKKLYTVNPEHIACDLHPEYLSTKYTKDLKIPITEVQHHHAHIASCMAENELSENVLGVSWDGTGLGTDGTIWGGEFLLSTLASFERSGYLRTFALPGGETAIKEPRRTALGLLYEIFQSDVFKMKELLPIQSFSGSERNLLANMLSKGINSPKTSSVGRLFDAVASIVGLYQKVSFEGQAAMALEFITESIFTDEQYHFDIYGQPFIVDWTPMVKEIINELQSEVGESTIAAKFHNTLVEIIVELAKRIQNTKVVLSGGCFQNKYLTERTIKRLREEGFRPYWHQRVSPNDGGISLGQAVVAASRLQG